MYKFEWDEEKNQINIQKHKISFEVAKFLFENPLATILDDRVDYNEKRYIGLGELESRLMVVVYTVRTQNIIRIISLRKANNREQTSYYEHKLG